MGSCSWQGTASLHLKLHSKINFFYICFTSAGWIPVTSSTWVPTESRGWTGKDSWWERINQLAWDPWFVTSTGILWQYSGTEFSFHFFFKPMSSPGMAKELGILGDFQEERGSLIAGGAGWVVGAGGERVLVSDFVSSFLSRILLLLYLRFPEHRECCCDQQEKGKHLRSWGWGQRQVNEEINQTNSIHFHIDAEPEICFPGLLRVFRLKLQLLVSQTLKLLTGKSVVN